MRINQHSSETYVSTLHVRLGCLLALLWVAAALPDVIQTFLGNRPTNDISFTPGWLKGIRDVSTLVTFLTVAWSVRPRQLFLRVLAVIAAVAFVGIGLANGASIDIAVRGVLCMPVVTWVLTTGPSGAAALYYIMRGLSRVLTPAAIATAVLLGFFGPGMYFESIGPYQRNPGLFLSPSATAFWAVASILLASDLSRRERWAAFLLGFLSMSGIFYINTLLFFGKIKRWIYLVAAGVAVVFLTTLGVEGLLEAASTVNIGVRSTDAVSITLLTRLAIINESITGFTLLGNFPRGLNVATNQGLDAFFPDNAFLAAGYAYGVLGLVAAVVLMVFAFRRRNFGVFLLMFSASFFYVWFENLLFAGVAGAMMNECFWQYRATRLKARR